MRVDGNILPFLVLGIAVAIVSRFCMSPAISSMQSTMDACRDAIAQSRLEVETSKAVKVCLSKTTEPFVVEVEIEEAEGRYQATRLKNFGLFLNPEISGCVLSAVNRKAKTIRSNFKAVTARTEFVRLQSKGEISTHSIPSCSYSKNEFRNEDTTLLRDSLYLKDSPPEQDESYREFQSCNKFIPAALRGETQIGNIRTKHVPQKNGEIKIDFLEVDFPQLSKPFNSCMSKALLKRREDSITPNVTVVINGQEAKPSAPWLVYEWIARKPNETLSNYYDWQKMGDLERMTNR